MSRDALVVGINTYQYSGLANLKAPSEDAEAIAQRLEQEGEFNVWRLPEAIDRETHRPLVGKTLKVELPQLKKALVKLFLPEGNSIPDTALFYFSGHGLRNTLGISEGFLATSDVNPDIEFNGLSLKWLRELLRESPIKQQIVWLDCCHSGELLNFKQEADPGEQGKGRDRCFIAASREFEGSFEEIGSAYSVLTRVLLEGLDPSRCPQRWVTNYSLVDYLNQHLQGATQHPTFTNFGEPINLTRTWEVPEQKVTSEPTQAFCPYKGLEYFDCNDEDPKYFYGRKELTDLLIDKVRQGNFLAIIGASGSGKSSVLRAGLLHQLKLGRQLAGSNQWQIQVMVPGSQPFLNLAAAFVEPNLSKLDRAEQLGRAEGLLKAGADGLRRLVQSSQASRLVLVIDQFEEVFTTVRDNAEREQFIDCLLGALKQLEEKLCLILAMRADFFSKCIEHNYSGLAQLIQENLVAVSPMEREQLQQAIVKPAERVNLKIEPELVEEMLQDVVNSPGSLPLLQYTLKELWKQRTDEGLKLASYAQLGGVGGTLDKRATEIFAQFPSPQQEVARHIFLNLTQLGEGTEDTRRRVEKRDLITARHPEALIDEVIGKLADKENRLIVTSELTAKGTATGGVVIVDVTHEALIRHWRLLRQWLNDSRDKLRQQRKIEAAADEWRNERQESPKTAKDYLLQGRRLREAREFQQEQSEQFPLSEFASEFIEKSLKHRQLNRLKVIGGLVIFPLIGTIWSGNLVYREVRIRQYWETVQKTQDEEYNATRIEALQKLNELKVPLRNAPLQNANLRQINLIGAKLSQAKLSQAKLSGAKLIGAYLSEADLSGADLSKAGLSYADLRGAKLSGADLSGADLSEAILFRAYLRGANFFRANLSRADLSGADLSGADLSGADLSEAYLSGADLSKVRNLTPKQVKSTCYWQKAEFDPYFEQKLKKEPNQQVNCIRWQSPTN
ncbi:MAG TPA: pentapeptide repeat-containing protein [Allocoleopsis sp.]